jgi:hypothetical protein
MKHKFVPAAPWRAALFALVLGVGVTTSHTALAQANARPPERMTYQGFLVDGNGAPLGNTAPKNYDAIFRVWSSESGSGNPERLWSEQQTVTVDKGYFSVLLGEGTEVAGEARPALPTLFKGATASDRWVGITVKGIGAGGANVDILPRMRLLSSPYAFLAEQATKLVREDNNSDLITSSGDVLSLNGHLDILGANSLEFGAGLTKQSDAGRMGYNLYNNAGNLDIVGAGTEGTTRKIKLWAEGGLTVGGPMTVEGAVTAPSFNGSFNGSGSALTGVAKTGANTFNGTQSVIGSVRVDADAVNTGTVFGSPALVFGPSGSGEGIASKRTAGDNANGLDLYTGYAARLSIRNSGNVGVGTTDPASKLHVNGSVAIQNNSVLQFGQGYTRETSAGQIGYGTHSGGASGSLDIVGAGTTASNRKISMWAEGGARINGTLRVTGGITSGAELVEAYLFTTGAFDFPNIAAPGFSIGVVADGGIRAASFFVASDRRIKNIVGQSDGKSDLATLKKIEITDYKYRDVVNQGSQTQKKVIAQQVEAVYPQAVSVTTGVVPDIYKKATSTNGWIQLQADLKADDRVRVVSGKGDQVHSVVAVQNPKPGSREEPKFRLDPPVSEGNVFVYGREVKDFRSVDYEAIAMLNVSATQELARRLEQREAELAELRAELAQARGEKQSLAENLTAMDARLNRLEKILKQQAAVGTEKSGAELVQVRN